MKAIKLLLSIIIALAIIIFLIAPPVMGLWAKYRCQHFFTQMNKSNARFQARMSDYHFGWFHSRATLEFDWHLHPRSPTPASDTIHIIGHIDMKHGPLVFMTQGQNRRFYIALAGMEAQVPLLNLNYRAIWHLNNAVTVQFSSPFFKITHHHLPIALQNLQGSGQYHLSTHQLQLQVMLNSFTFLHAIRLNNLVYTTDIQQKDYINLGQQTLIADTIAINTIVNPLELNHVFATSNTMLTNGKIIMAVKARAQSISKNEFGIHGAHIDFAIHQIDEKTLNTLLKTLEEQQNNTSNKKTDYQAIATASINFLRQGLALKINDLTLKTDDGSALVNGSFVIPSLNKDATILHLPVALQIDLHLQVPKNWLKQLMTTLGLTQQLNDWEQQKILDSSGNDYKIQIQLQNGHLLINGKTPSLNPQNIQNPQKQVILQHKPMTSING